MGTKPSRQERQSAAEITHSERDIPIKEEEFFISKDSRHRARAVASGIKFRLV